MSETKFIEARAAKLPWDVAEAFVKAMTDPERWEQTAPDIQRRIVEHYLHIPDAIVTPVVTELVAERDALQRFKDYVHARLDAAGVPVDPDSPHKAEGCRIGGRLDVLFSRSGYEVAAEWRNKYLSACAEPMAVQRDLLKAACRDAVERLGMAEVWPCVGVPECIARIEAALANSPEANP